MEIVDITDEQDDFGDVSPFINYDTDSKVDSKVNEINKFDDTDEKNALHQLKELYGDQSQLMSKTLSLYKVFSQDVSFEQPIWSKTDQDILKDISESTFNLGLSEFVKENYNKILSSEYKTHLIVQKTKILPVLLDCCWVYYVHHFNKDAPLYMMPKTALKMKVLLRYLPKPKTERIERIERLMLEIINNPFIKDMRRENPPFHLTTDMEHDEINKIIMTTIKPMLKELLEHLLRINIQHIKSNSTSDGLNIDNAESLNKVIQAHQQQREDNI